MKSHMLLMREVLDDLGTRCSTSTTRDYEYIARRVEREGLSYMTITLPQFAKDFERSLAQGEVSSTLFAGYRKRGRLPQLFAGFVGRVFDTKTGALKSDPDIDCIYAVRQACLLFSKINLPCSDARVAKAIDRFLAAEQEVRDNDASLEYSDVERFKRMSIVLWGKIIRDLDLTIWNGDIVPRHGPGATADKLQGNAKFDQFEWTERLERYFPFGEFLVPSLRFHQEMEPRFHFLDPGAERPVKVTTVPKTLKTPRIIAIEPTCMQYVQQGIMLHLVEAIEGDELLSNFVGFRDQVPNQELAMEGSLTGGLATLDLSEASDRVSNQLVRAMFAYYHHASEGIQACRSRKADVPGHGVIRLAKFASMGSALTFPLEAMIFAIVVFLGIEKDLRRPLTGRDLLDYVGKVRIYGDDIVVPVDHVRSVVESLETFGFRVNSDKSFWTGEFRESCGKEYYAGVDVSCVRVREALPSQRRHVAGVVSTVSLRNQMYYAGNWRTAAHLDKLLEKLIPFPRVLPTSPALGRNSYLGYDSSRLCPHLQKDLVRAFRVVGDPPRSNLDGYSALLKFFLKRSAEPTADEKHLERAGRPKAVYIKLGWVAPY